MANTTSSAQARKNITPIQEQIQRECYEMSVALSNLGSNAMQAETSSRKGKSTGFIIGGIVLGILFLMGGVWWLGIGIGIAGIVIGYNMRFLDTDRNALNSAINVLNQSLNQNSFLNNNTQNSR